MLKEKKDAKRKSARTRSEHFFFYLM